MAKKKNNTYYLCQQTKKNNIIELNNLSLADIKNNNIVFCDDIIDGEVVSSTSIPTESSIRDRKLADLLESAIFNDLFWVIEDEEGNQDEESKYGFDINTVVQKILDNFLIVRYENKEKKYFIFTKEQIKNSIDQILEINNELYDAKDDIDFNIINTLEDDVINSLTVSTKAFIDDILPKCLGKFKEGMIAISTLNHNSTWNIEKIIEEDKQFIKFGTNDYEDAIFKAKIYEYLCFEDTSVVVSIKSDSKVNDKQFYYEHYGFKFNMGEIACLTAKGLYSAVKDSEKDDKGSVFCDINGERIIGG